MPATAADMAGRDLNDDELSEPSFNIELGAAYLSYLLDRWDGNPILTIASYNAGPGAVASWPSQDINQAPELWIERIPYPETRYYTKKVLDNLIQYISQDELASCEKGGSGTGEKISNPDSAKKNE